MTKVTKIVERGHQLRWPKTYVVGWVKPKSATDLVGFANFVSFSNY